MSNWKEEILPFIPDRAVTAINKLPTSVLCKITEIRLRSSGVCSITAGTENRILFYDNQPITLSPDEIKHAFSRLCDGAIFKYENCIPKGYITISGGHRVGFCGKAIYTNGTITNITDISSIVFRISKQIINCSDKLINEIVSDDYVYSTLIVGEPCSGKTTLLTDIARMLSILGFRSCVIDERNEISAMCASMPGKNVGNLTDVLSEYSKSDGLMTALRCLSPQVMICDEIGGSDDVNAILEAVNAGVPIIVSTHAISEQQLLERPQIERLIDHGAIDKIIILQGSKSPGKIRKVIKVNRYDENSWNSYSDN